MNMGHFGLLLLVLVVGFWIGQTRPALLGGYPQKLFG